MRMRMNVLFIGMDGLFIYFKMKRSTSIIFWRNGALLLLLLTKSRRRMIFPSQYTLTGISEMTRDTSAPLVMTKEHQISAFYTACTAGRHTSTDTMVEFRFSTLSSSNPKEPKWVSRVDNGVVFSLFKQRKPRKVYGKPAFIHVDNGRTTRFPAWSFF